MPLSPTFFSFLQPAPPHPRLRAAVRPGSELLADAAAAAEAAALLRLCFPENHPPPSAGLDEDDDSSTTRSVLEDGLGFHDVEDALWILLREEEEDRDDDYSAGGCRTGIGDWEGGGRLRGGNCNGAGGGEKGPVIAALAAVVPYHDGLYVCNLCVHPLLRRRGVGLDVLEAAARVAAGQCGRDALLGNARTDHDGGALRRYYEKLGATAVMSGFGGGGGGNDGGGGGGGDSFMGHVRLRRTVGSSEAEVADLFASLREGRRQRHRARLVRRAAVCGVAVCGLIAVAFAGPRRQREPRATLS